MVSELVSERLTPDEQLALRGLLRNATPDDLAPHELATLEKFVNHAASAHPWRFRWADLKARLALWRAGGSYERWRARRDAPRV